MYLRFVTIVRRTIVPKPGQTGFQNSNTAMGGVHRMLLGVHG